ncbi:response regulator receiver sensor signal transduction histidine kinase [Chondrocystis sp. NIES-4102]|nr:response regulator receiver sensor signal transduction histidine kinase [Chondrocystis sp. NIES-4102]
MKKLMMAQELNNILVVDDTPQNLHLLVDILTKYDYKVRPVPNGKLAISAAQINPPDLILLDIMMPDLDGYQVCKQLKANPITKDIPIIFISAINEPVDKVKAFAIGGVDYITKPFQMHEVLIRVKHQIALVNLKKQLKLKNEQLNNTVKQLQQNQKKIVKSSTYSALETITSGLIEQLNYPLSEINSCLAELKEYGSASVKDLPNFLQQISPEEQKYFQALLKQAQSNRVNTLLSPTEKSELKSKIINQLVRLKLEKTAQLADMLIELGSDEEINELIPLLTGNNYLEIIENACLLHKLQQNLDKITESTTRFSHLTNGLKNYGESQKTQSEKRPAHLENTVEMALKLVGAKITPGIQIIKNYSNVPTICCYPEKLQIVWVNLIKNAIEAIGTHGILTINIYQQEDNLAVDIIDTGEGIESKIVTKLCEPFFTTKPSGEHTGLGLTIAKQFIEQHDGIISIATLSSKATLPGNTKFTVSLPLNISKI